MEGERETGGGGGEGGADRESLCSGQEGICFLALIDFISPDMDRKAMLCCASCHGVCCGATGQFSGALWRTLMMDRRVAARDEIARTRTTWRKLIVAVLVK